MEPFLRVCDISYAYHSPLGATPALSGISFTVNKGEFLAIVGPSGSGKTTMCNLIARFWDVDAGRITVGGKDVRDFKLDSPDEEYRHGISRTCICLPIRLRQHQIRLARMPRTNRW